MKTKKKETILNNDDDGMDGCGTGSSGSGSGAWI